MFFSRGCRDVQAKDDVIDYKMYNLHVSDAIRQLGKRREKFSAFSGMFMFMAFLALYVACRRFPYRDDRMSF